MRILYVDVILLLMMTTAVGCSERTAVHGIEFVSIPAGEFLMGNANPNEAGEYSQCEGPQHRVQITRPIRMSKYEITVAQFRQFVEETGYVTDVERSGKGCNGLNAETGQVERSAERNWRSPGFEQLENYPVVCVSRDDAIAFCQWLSQRLNSRCRLPAEAEWEFCCRAGTSTRFATGDSAESLQGFANCGDQTLVEKFPQFESSAATWADGYPFTAPVGSFGANAFGLYDMHGNVGEWCSDLFDPSYYSQSDSVDPEGPPEEPVSDVNQNPVRFWRVVRGGSWYNAPLSLRSSGRHDGVPTEPSTTNGFRVVAETDSSSRGVVAE
ncbi:MAG: formylglycine-generating enzyme family protein [Planctomyces sp.]|nr:formylglycine-generating enzyme family protein [Planctomyces sp.]